MNIQLQVGKSYRSRDGRKATVIFHIQGSNVFDAQFEDNTVECYFSNGRQNQRRELPIDLIAEWIDPSTVTKVTLPSGLDDEWKRQLTLHQELMAKGLHIDMAALQPKCTCDSRDLFNFGCRCGQIQRERA